MSAAAHPEAADLVERFADAWSKMDPDAFTPLFHPDVHLIHPIERDTHGVDEAREFMKRTMSVMPDLRYDVQGWASGSGHVVIWGRLHGTLGGGPIEWPLIDRIKLEDGLIRERGRVLRPAHDPRRPDPTPPRMAALPRRPASQAAWQVDRPRELAAGFSARVRSGPAD
jgi:ketosteroid isomerase-like protein